MAGPIFNEAGKLLGIVSNNLVIGPTGANIAFVRGNDIFSFGSARLGRIVELRGRLIWVSD